MTRSALPMAFGLVLAGCSATEPSQQSTLRHNQARWEARQPAAYEFALQRGYCECLSEWMIPMRIAVRGEEISSVVNLATGDTVPAAVHGAMTVADLFSFVEDALDREAYQLSVVYDDEWGYPRSIVVDYDQQYVDDELSYTAGELRPTTQTPAGS